MKTWARERPRTVIVLALAVGLGPFLNKAVHWDDSLFVWTAQHILRHPVDFFGFDVNWWYSASPMWVANCNPPLFSYLLAGVVFLGGTGEIPMHLAGFGVACAAALGIYSLARAWCTRPLLATFAAIVTPSFLVSATTLMCDVAMLALWVWSLVLFERGFGRQNRAAIGTFALAGALAGLALLTKYSVVFVLPLFPVLGFWRTRRPGWWLLGVIIPMAVLGAYEALTAHFYGTGLFQAAIHYCRAHPQPFPGGAPAQGIVGLAYVGGCLLPALFFVPLLWRPGTWLPVTVIMLGGLLWLFHANGHLGLIIMGSNEPMKRWAFVFQLAVFTAAGLHIIFLTAVETWRRRDVAGIMLGLWIASGLVFATALNWTVNARSFLPIVPAVAILLVRRLEFMAAGPAARSADHGRLALVLAPSTAVALSLAVADYTLAGSGRQAARDIQAKYGGRGHQIWFEGHDAFQYYMEAFGARPIDTERTLLEPEDVVVVPLRGLRTVLPAYTVGWQENLRYQPVSWFNLMGENGSSATGFYAAFGGPAPFAFGRLVAQDYVVLKVFSRVQFNSPPATNDITNVRAVSECTSWITDRTNFEPGIEVAARINSAQKLAEQGDASTAIAACRAALKQDPGNPFFLNHLAWLLATSERPEFQNGVEAVQLATLAVDITGKRSAVVLGTLGAAYAQRGDFPLARRTASMGAVLANLTGQTDVARANQRLVLLFDSGHTAATLPKKQPDQE